MNTAASDRDDFEKRLLELRPVKNSMPEAQVQYRCGYEAGFRQGLLAVDSKLTSRVKHWSVVTLAATLLISCVGVAAYRLGRNANATIQPIADSSPKFADESTPKDGASEDIPEIAGSKTLRMSEVEVAPAFPPAESWWLSLVNLGRRSTVESADVLTPLTLGSSIKLRNLAHGESSDFLLAHSLLNAPAGGAAKVGETTDSETASAPYSVRMSSEAWSDLLRSL